MLQLLGDFVPQTLYRGSAPGPCWGTSVLSLRLRAPPQLLSHGCPPTLLSTSNSLCIVQTDIDAL